MATGIRTIGELFGCQRKAKANAPITHRGSEPPSEPVHHVLMS